MTASSIDAQIPEVCIRSAHPRIGPLVANGQVVTMSVNHTGWLATMVKINFSVTISQKLCWAKKGTDDDNNDDRPTPEVRAISASVAVAVEADLSNI